jgi:hypothetical protein
MMKSSITELQGMVGGEMGQSMQQLRQSAASGEGQMRATLDLAKEMGSGIARQQEMRKARGAMLFQEYPLLPPAAAYVAKDNIVDLELSEYAGYSGIIVANGGLEPTENSFFFRKHGFKLRIKLSEEESWPALNAGRIAAAATTVDVLTAYCRNFQVVAPGADRLFPRRGRSGRAQGDPADQRPEGQDAGHGPVHGVGLFYALSRPGGGARGAHAALADGPRRPGTAESALRRGRLHRR